MSECMLISATRIDSQSPVTVTVVAPVAPAIVADVTPLRATNFIGTSNTFTATMTSAGAPATPAVAVASTVGAVVFVTLTPGVLAMKTVATGAGVLTVTVPMTLTFCAPLLPH